MRRFFAYAQSGIHLVLAACLLGTSLPAYAGQPTAQFDDRYPIRPIEASPEITAQEFTTSSNLVYHRLADQERSARPQPKTISAELVGTVMGRVINASSGSPLSGVTVVAQGDDLPGNSLFLPLISSDAGKSQAAQKSATQPQSDSPVLNPNRLESGTVTASKFETKTGSDGEFSLDLPPGEFDISFERAGFTLDRRVTTVTLNRTASVQEVRLHPLDSNSKQIGTGGGSVVNSLDNSSLEFDPGALATTEDIRVTYLPNDALPGDFPDGSVPMGFSNFEPEGLVFPQGKEVLWTVAYEGELPVGTDTLCYWWDGDEGRWKDPVPGKVVDVGGGKKALQARVPHFSAYGHALPGVAGQRPSQNGDIRIYLQNIGEGGNQCRIPGSSINVGAGSVAESYTFLPVSGRGFPVVLQPRYSTSNDTPSVTAQVPFTITSQQPARVEWRMTFQGKTYQGTGFTASANWDTTNGLGYRVAPGIYPFEATETFFYSSGAQPSLTVEGTVEVRRGDIWPFGFGWMTAYDTLLVDQGDTATIIQGDGQYLTYTRQSDGSYNPGAGDYSALRKEGDGSWVRTGKYGAQELFDSRGRLVRVQDRNGNRHTLDYEPSGRALATGEWGLAERLVAITDASGRSTRLAYGANGYVNKVTDPIGREYTLGHDGAGNLTLITDPLGRVYRYAYDSNHLLNSYTFPLNNQTRLAYNGERQIVGRTNALGGQRSLDYTGNRTEYENENGVTTSYERNSVGAITRVEGPESTTDITWNDERQMVGKSPPPVRFSYDDRGNLVTFGSFADIEYEYEATFNQPTTTVDTAGNRIQYEYDSAGNLVNLTNAAGHTFQFTYDAAGQPIQLQDPFSHTVSAEYDDFGNLISVEDPLGHTTGFTYDAAGNMTAVEDANGKTTSYVYDAANRLTQTTNAAGHSTTYVYDANDNLIGVTDAKGGSTSFVYDGLDRLTQTADPLGRKMTFAYDAVGNLTVLADANGGEIRYEYDDANRLVEERFSDDGSVAYTYNEIGDRVTEIGPANQVTYTYNLEIPGTPDQVETRLLGSPVVRTQINYDFVSAGSSTRSYRGSSLAGSSIIIEDPPTSNSEAFPGATATTQTLAENQRVGASEPFPGAGLTSQAAPYPEKASFDSGGVFQPDIESSAPYAKQPVAASTDVCGTLNSDTTWTTAQSPYVVTCDVVVSAGVKLTIDPGVVVKFQDWYDDLVINGTLLAAGTGANPITFTSLLDDSVGGDTNGDGNATQPAPDNWSSVRFAVSSTGNVLDHVIVRYGGGQASENVYVNTTDIGITNSTFAYANGSGIKFDNALPSTFTGNTFTDNTGAAVWAPLSSNTDSIVLSGNSGRGNQFNGFLTEGSISGSVNWDGDDVFPFVIWTDLTIAQGATLTLTENTIIKFHDWYDDLVVNGTLVADTTGAAPIIFTSVLDDSVGGDTNDDGSATQPAPDKWSALHFTAQSTGSILNNVIVRYGGGQSAENVYVNTNDISIANSTFAYANGSGIKFDNALPSSLTSNTFISNTGSAVWAPLVNNTDSIVLSGNSGSGNQFNGFVTEGSISGSVNWDGDDGFPFVIWTDLTIASGAVLTLAEKTIVKFHDWYDDLVVNGTLVADTTGAAPIIFTSVLDDSVGGDTNDDGSDTQPAPDNWSALHFTAQSMGSILDHVVVRYGGGQSAENVNVKTTDISIANSTFAYANGSGIKFDNALPSALTNNTFTGNTGSAVWAPLVNNIDSIVLSGNSGSGNQFNGFVTEGSISGSVNWDGDDGFPFVVWTDLTITSGATLTLAENVIVKFHDWYDDLVVNGRLLADTTGAAPIFFTSVLDDSVGGDTNDDGNASQPTANSWSGLRFTAQGTGSVLDNVVVRYGGGQSSENIYVNTPTIAIDNSTIAYASGSGMTIDGVAPTLTNNSMTDNSVGVTVINGGDPVLRNNRITRNTDYGVRNQGGAAMIDAQNNWWGSATGPLDNSDDRGTGGLYNPTGAGDRVTDGVDYDPWLQITGLLYGISIATGNNGVQAVDYEYNSLNGLEKLTAAGPAAFRYEYTYDAANRLTSVGPDTSAPGVRTDLTYNAGSQLTQLVNRSQVSSRQGQESILSDLRYSYDGVGNVTSLIDSKGTTNYTYDAVNRLRAVSGPGINESYSYDVAGNRTAKGGVTYTYNSANQLTAASNGSTYSYDANGNLISMTKGTQTTSYTWDVNDQLVRIDFPDSSYAAYTYDTQGRRISKRDRAGVRVSYVYDGLNLVQEVDSAGAVIANYVYDGLDHPLSMARGGQRYYYLYDRLGSVIGLTNESGTLVATYRYDPWGNILETGGANPNLANPFRFTGREWDAESGLYFYRSRYYDPDTARFISSDPIRMATLEPTPYAYVGNNPLNSTDPLGLSKWSRRWWQAIAGIGAGVVVGGGILLTAPISVGAVTVTAAVGWGLGAVAAGTTAGGLVGAGIEKIYGTCGDTDLWEGFKQGAKGGFAGSSTTALLIFNAGAAGALNKTSAASSLYQSASSSLSAGGEAIVKAYESQFWNTSAFRLNLAKYVLFPASIYGQWWANAREREYERRRGIYSR